MKYSENSPRKFISLFSGIGGIDEGFHRIGFTPILCCEKDPNAQETLLNWLHLKNVEAPIYNDIKELNPSSLLNQLNLLPGELDALVGGPPCQAFSLIGKRESVSDERGMLLFEMIKFAEVFLPKVVLIEQVRGLISAQCKKNKPGGVLAELISQLEKLGYFVEYKVLRAADYGVPQLRDRLFVVATRHKPFEFPKPTHAPFEKFENYQLSILSSKAPYRTVRDAICDLPEPSKKGEPETFPNHVDITPARDRERILGVPEGDCLARQIQLPKSQRLGLDPKKDTTKFRRLSWDKPSLTLRGGEAFYHPIENRYLTPREFLRIHGFDDELILYGPIRGRTGTVKTLDQHRLVANAVPPLLAEVLAKALIQQGHFINIKNKELIITV